MKKQNCLSLVMLVAVFFMAIGETLAQQPEIGYFRYPDQRGINVFESPKTSDVEFTGLKVRVGGNFAQQYQALSHENTADPDSAVFQGNPIDLNKPYPLGPGFNLATANLNLDVALAPGIRLNLVTYLSARHHPEAWVKGGYIQIDELSIFNSEVVDNIMKPLTIKIGHMEINYGDQHFRRSDNGNALYNPLVGNTIMDAFTTEIGGEIYYRPSDFIFMVGLTGGLITGDVDSTNAPKNPSILGKVGWDKQLNDNIRLRITGSIYHNGNTSRNTLYGGDRAGSRYYLAAEQEFASNRFGQIVSVGAQSFFTSGRFNPGFTNSVTSIMINPFVKIYGLEIFGMYETSSGNFRENFEKYSWNQIMAEAVFRFLKDEQVFVAARYNVASGPIVQYNFAPGDDFGTIASQTDVSISRIQAGAGWFITKNIVAKAEYVIQNYNDFDPSDFRNGLTFNGVMVEAVVGF